jgi:hypothetical protein
MVFCDLARMVRFELIAVLVMLSVGFMAGCGGDEEETAAVDSATATKAAPAPSAVEPAPELDELPAVSMLKYAPETAAVAAAFGSVTDIYDEATVLVQRFAPPGVDVGLLLSQAIAEARAKRELGDARSVPDILRQEGIDPDGPAAVFVGVEATMASLEQAAQAKQAAETETIAEEGTEAPAPEAAPEVAPEAEPAPAPEVVPPDWASMITVSDRDAFEQMVVAESTTEGVPLPEPTESQVAGQTIVSYGERDALNYFFFDNRAVVGESLAFVTQVAEQIAAPREVNYGTDAMPASPDDIAVALVRLDMVPSIMEAGLPLAAQVDADSLGMLQAQLAMARQMHAAYQGEDPLVVTVSSNEQKFEVLTRIDYKTHPNLRTVTGDAAPLRLAQAFPASTGALASLRLTPEFKQQLQETWLENLPQDMQQDPQMFQAMLVVRQVLQLVGNEIAIGVTGQQEIQMPSFTPQQPAPGASQQITVPSVVLMIDLAQPETLEGLLMLMPSMPGEPYNDIEVKKIALPIPVELVYAVIENTFVAATSRGELTAAIDGIRGADTGLFASMQPPLDPQADRFSLFFVQGRLYDDLLAQLVEEDEEVRQYLAGVSRQVQSLVSTQEMVDGVLHGSVAFNLRPIETAVE